VRFLIFMLAVLSGVAGTTWGHGGTITGIVAVTETGEAIPFATVQIDGTRIGGRADENGAYRLNRVPHGRQTVVVSAVGYGTLTKQVDIGEGPIEIDFRLVTTPLDAGTIVVTGTRTPRFVKDAPVFTEVVTRNSIEDKAAHNVMEALEGEAGVRVEQQCQGCNFSILRLQGLGADHTQVLLDGQPIYSGLASVYGLQQMSTADIDQIEIVKGAGSALYGSSAVAGAINIISCTPRQTEGQLNIEFGEYGTSMYEITASTREDNIGVFVFAQQNEQDEIDDTGDSDAPGGVDNPDGWLDRVRSSSRNAGFNLFVDDALTTDQLVIRGRAMNESRKGGWLSDNLFENPFAEGSEHITTDRLTAQISYQLWLPGGGELGTNLSITSHKRNATNDTFLGDYEIATGESPAVSLLRPYTADERLVVAGVSLIQPLRHRHRLLSGLQVSYNKLEESGMYVDRETAQPYTSSSEKSATELGAYLQDEFAVTNELEIVGGLRFDHHSSTDEFRGSGDVLPQGLEPLEYDEWTINPRLAVKYFPTARLVLRWTVGTGFRVPYGFSEDLHLCSGSPRVYKGGDLKPERSRSYSVTADYTDVKWTASVNCYRTDLQSAISFAEADEAVAELGYTYEWRNVDDAYVTGLEINGSVALASSLTAAVRFEYFHGKYDNPREDWVGTTFENDSRRISRYPETSGGMKLKFSPRLWGFVLDADYRGTMHIDLLKPEDPADVKIHHTESYVILNAKITREILGDCKLYVGARNLTDYTQEEKHVSDAAFMYAPVYGRIIYG